MEYLNITEDGTNGKNTSQNERRLSLVLCRNSLGILQRLRSRDESSSLTWYQTLVEVGTFLKLQMYFYHVSYTKTGRKKCKLSFDDVARRFIIGKWLI